MSGFAGFIGDTRDSKACLNVMLEKIQHRNPECLGTYEDEYLHIGFRSRHKISANTFNPKEAVFNADKTVLCVLNGVLYNKNALREELEKDGYTFTTETDNEILIYLYDKHGREMLNKLRGMFMFVIYNTESKEIFGAKDHFGIKPFYYSLENDKFIFASEIKSILEHPDVKKELNPLALENYLTFQYSVLNETFFKGIFRLYPAHGFVYKDGKMDIFRYYEPKFEETPMSIDEAVTKLEAALDESIKLHEDADSEIGSFLSSGVDSSYVAARFSGTKTFTLGFDDENYNEAGYAKRMAEKIGKEHISELLSTDEYWDTLGKIQYLMDEPLADPSAVGLYFATKLASKHVKVCFSGEGADEFFGGYNIYREPVDIAFLTRLPKPVRRFLGGFAKKIPFKVKGKNLLIRASQDVEERFIGNAKIFTKNEREKILLNPIGKYDPKDLTKPYYAKVADNDDVAKMQFIDINFWCTGDILLKADRMSNANALEVRMPILDIEVFEVARKFPTHLKAGKDGTKIAFRKIAEKYIPLDIAQRKKLGFPTPTRAWLKIDKYYTIVKNTFKNDIAKKFFDTDEILKLLEEHKNGKSDNSRKVWTIFVFIVWYEQYFG